jgi:hypothetical protein
MVPAEIRAEEIKMAAGVARLIIVLIMVTLAGAILAAVPVAPVLLRMFAPAVRVVLLIVKTTVIIAATMAAADRAAPVLRVRLAITTSSVASRSPTPIFVPIIVLSVAV